MRRILLLALFALALLPNGCARNEIKSPGDPSRKFTGTSYYESGEVMFMSVDVRAARIGGPRNMLPLYVVIVKHKGNEATYIGRESFVLELPDHTTIPLAGYDEFNDDYGRSQVDIRAMAQQFDSIGTRFPEPPFSWLPLEFFPPKGSGDFPRETVDIRARQLVHGFLYFRLPEDPPRDARYKLLMKPQRSEVTYVVDFPPFADDGGSR